MQNNTAPKPKTAILAGLINREHTEEQITEYLDELAFLAETDGMQIIKRFTQRLDNPEPSTFFGKGKLQEIKEYVIAKNISTLIFDDELTGTQLNNIAKIVECKVIDRSDLILEIFAKRARTSQAKAQVELAQLQYTLPRLKGMWSHLERQRGGTGARGGAGEKEIETDRRRVNQKISNLKKDLETIDKQSETQRKNRGELIRVALVGYTNVGKSTIMKLLSKADVFAENKLFATLDTTVRKVVLNTTPFLLSDTVGFIRKLPHHLIESFKSTLDEVREADILLHIVDISHPQFEEQIKVVNTTLLELKASEKMTVLVFNKMDLYEQKTFDDLLPIEEKQDILANLKNGWIAKTNDNCIFISATEKRNMEEFREKIFTAVKKMYQVRYPYRTEFY